MFFTRFRPFGVDLQKKICKSTPNGLKRVKNTKLPTHPPQRRCRWIILLEYVNKSYHTISLQNLSINVASIHKRVLVAWKCTNAPPPLPQVHLHFLLYLITPYLTQIQTQGFLYVFAWKLHIWFFSPPFFGIFHRPFSFSSPKLYLVPENNVLSNILSYHLDPQ